MIESDKHLWDQFCKLGEWIGDGLHREPGGGWISREYRKLAKILVPEDKEASRSRRKLRASIMDTKIHELVQVKKCQCGGLLEQRRSGSKVVYCTVCNSRYVASKKKNTG